MTATAARRITQPTVTIRRRRFPDGHVEHRVIVDRRGVGYVWREGRVWRARLVGADGELPGRWLTRAAAAEHVAEVA